MREGGKKFKLKDTIYYSIGLMAEILVHKVGHELHAVFSYTGDSQKETNNN